MAFMYLKKGSKLESFILTLGYSITCNLINKYENKKADYYLIVNQYNLTMEQKIFLKAQLRYGSDHAISIPTRIDLVDACRIYTVKRLSDNGLENEAIALKTSLCKNLIARAVNINDRYLLEI